MPDNIPKATPWGPSETFLECGPDGVVRVKDGRTLEEYINDPRLVNRRRLILAAGAQHPIPMILVTKNVVERGLMPRIA